MSGDRVPPFVGDGAARGDPALRLPSALVALEFLTVLRLRRTPLTDAAGLAAAQAWYPLVGLLLGLGLAGLDLLLRGRVPAAPLAVLLLIALEGMTGLLHLDGLADSADGLLGLHSRERRLEIMRDSRLGAFGAAALVFYLLLMYACLSTLSGPARSSALIGAPVAGRGAMTLLSALFAYARPSGLGLGFQRAAQGAPGVIAAVSFVAILLLVAGPAGLIPAAAGLLAACAVGLLARARLGGLTGDVFGAGCELAQVASLCMAGALQGQPWFRPWL